MNLPLTLVEIFEKETNEKLEKSVAQVPSPSKLKLLPGNKLKIDASLMRGFFDKAVENAIHYVQTFHDAENKYNLSVALLVGGFSESPMLANAVKIRCPSWNLVVPDDAGLVVLKGAVLFGHNPSAITFRVCRYTYGKAALIQFKDGVHPTELLTKNSDGERFCSCIFVPFINEGTVYKAGDNVFKEISIPFSGNLDSFLIRIYASTDNDVKYTTEDCCTCVGILRVNQLDMTKPRKERKCRTIISMGNTEMIVESTDVNSGRRLKTSLDLLD